MALEAHLDVVCTHTCQAELRTHSGVAQQGVQNRLERAHGTADGSTNDHRQFVLNEINIRHPAPMRLLLQEGQHARGQQREETIVPDGR